MINTIFKRLRIFIFLIAILNISCATQENNVVLEKFERKNAITIEKEEILKDQFDPEAIYLMDSVIVLDSRGLDNYLFSIIDTSSFKELARFGLQGKGPLEIGVPGFFDKINSDSILVGDLTDYNVYLFSIKNILKGNLLPLKVYNTRNSKGNVMSNSLLMMNNNEIIGAGIHAEGRYALYDETGMIKNYFVEYPKLEFTSENPLLQAMAYQSVICKQTNGNLFASLSHGIIDILEYKSSNILLKKRFEHYKDEMKNTGNVDIDGIVIPTVATSIKSIVGFEDNHFQATTTSIYSLFSSRTQEEFEEHHSRRLFSDLLVFDWNGNAQVHYQFDKEVFGFAVSENNKDIFFLAYNKEGETIIIKAKLNKSNK